MLSLKVVTFLPPRTESKKKRRKKREKEGRRRKRKIYVLRFIDTYTFYRWKKGLVVKVKLLSEIRKTVGTLGGDELKSFIDEI